MTGQDTPACQDCECSARFDDDHAPWCDGPGTHTTGVPADDLDDTPCQPNDFGYCRWCGRDMMPAPATCPAHGWCGCMCSGSPNYQVSTHLVAPEDR
jgi:hypothetical protein